MFPNIYKNFIFFLIPIYLNRANNKQLKTAIKKSKIKDLIHPIN